MPLKRTQRYVTEAKMVFIEIHTLEVNMPSVIILEGFRWVYEDTLSQHQVAKDNTNPLQPQFQPMKKNFSRARSLRVLSVVIFVSNLCIRTGNLTVRKSILHIRTVIMPARRSILTVRRFCEL
jgi:hypothetical protein